MDPFCNLSSCLFLLCCFVCSLQPCNSPAEGGLTFWLSCALCFLVFCHYPTWCPVSGMVLDCIDSWSFPSYSQTSNTFISSYQKLWCWYLYVDLSLLSEQEIQFAAGTKLNQLIKGNK